MKRGLYVRAGDFATARLAACAISLFGPTTNDSKLLRGFRPSALPFVFVSRAVTGASSGSSISSAGASVTVAAPSDGILNFIARGVPHAATTADCKAVMWLLSIQNW